MKDFTPKGTGNSRFLKSVANFKTLYPDYDSFATALITGTLPIDLNGVNPYGYDQLGTPLNKANLLTDATAMALELSGDPSVNEALLKLSGKANIEVVSYTGTGLFGVDNPCAITFSHPVEIIINIGIAWTNYNGTSSISDTTRLSVSMADESESYQRGQGFFVNMEPYRNSPYEVFYSYGKRSADKKTYSWYTNAGAIAQMNLSGTKYYFMGVW